jgi:hypothetical protein
MTITLLWRACMKRLDFRTVMVVAFLAVGGACEGDPTEALRAGPDQLSLNPDLIFIDSGTTTGFEVIVRD